MSTTPPLPPSPLQYQTPDNKPAGAGGLAIASLVCGLVSFCMPLLALVSIPLGIVALARRKHPQQRGKGFAIAGIATGAVALLLYAAIIPPALNAARRSTNLIKSASNMRQIGLGLKLYANETPGYLFPPSLVELAQTQDLTAGVFVAPNSTDTSASVAAGSVDPKVWAPKIVPGNGFCSYYYLGAGMNDSVSGDVILLYELPAINNARGANFLYADGHVDFVDEPQATNIINQLKAGTNPPK